MSYKDYHVPGDLSTVEDVRSWCKNINASPEAVAVWAYQMYKLARVKGDLYHRLATSLAYMGFDQFHDEYADLWKCVLSGKSTVPIQPDGTLMSCGCLASVAAMATYTEAALCPKCKVPFSKAQRVEKEAARNFSELSIAIDLAGAGDDKIEAAVTASRKMIVGLTEVPPAEMPFQKLVLEFKGGAEEAKKIRAKARQMCIAERKRLTQRAALLGKHALKDVQGKYQQPPPIPRDTARAGSGAAAAPAPQAQPERKRKADDVNMIPSNERMDEPMPEGAQLNSRSVKVGSAWLMPTKFAKAKCPGCPSPMIANRTLVANMKEDGRNNWVCALCAVGMTSAEAYEVAMGRRPQPAAKPVPSSGGGGRDAGGAPPPKQAKAAMTSMMDGFEI